MANKSLEEWLDHIGRQHSQTIDMGLDRMHTLLARLSLEPVADCVITVAGTNGKGSTCVATEQLLLDRGKTVGTTLSPHVTRFNERVRIDGAEVPDARLCDAFARIEAAREGTPLTYFEFGALAALWCFKEAAVDIAILEIGLGGRLDAFNALDADIAVITSIGFDHQEYLGDTLDLIGLEKAGILRAGQTVVLGVDLPESVRARCTELGLEPLVCGRDFVFVNANFTTWRYEACGGLAFDIERGQVAAHNAALALTVAERCVGFDEASIKRVLPTIKMPGRCEERRIDGRRYIFDVCHNPQGAAFLCNELKVRGLAPVLAVGGMLTGKQHAEVFSIVGNELKAPFAFLSTHGDREMSADALAHAVGAEAEDSPRIDGFEALRRFVVSATQEGDVILVFGSFNAVEQGATAT